MTAAHVGLAIGHATCVGVGVASPSVGGGLRDGLGDDARLVQNQNVPLLLRDLLRAQVLVLERYAGNGGPK